MDDVKHRVRKLKQSEKVIRFRDDPNPGAAFVWYGFFDLHDTPTGKARYTLAELSSMHRDEYKRVVAEFYALVYYKYYLENDIVNVNMYSPSLLAKLSLPYNAEEQDIKKRFRELAKEYHPDTGGDASKFIELMQVYEQLIMGVKPPSP